MLPLGVPGHSANAGVLLGTILFEGGDLAGAQSVLERTLEYRDVPLRAWPSDPSMGVPRDAINWVCYAAIGLEGVREQLGDHEGARQAKELAFELSVTDEPAQFDLNRGERFDSFGYVSGAKRAYEQAVAANHPRWSGLAAHALGHLLAVEGDDEGACAAYERAIVLGDDRIAEWARFQIETIRSRRAGPAF